MTSWLSWSVGAVLAGWFLLTVVRNTPRLRTILGNGKLELFLPDWELFARPFTKDLVLLRRDLLLDGTVTSWQQVEVAGPRRWYNVVWHPDMGPRRTFLSHAAHIVAAAGKGRGMVWPTPGQGTPTALSNMMTIPYLAVLRHVSQDPHPGVEATQFMVASLEAQAIAGPFDLSEPGRVEFVSEWHLVGDVGEGSAPVAPQRRARAGPAPAPVSGRSAAPDGSVL